MSYRCARWFNQFFHKNNAQAFSLAPGHCRLYYSWSKGELIRPRVVWDISFADWSTKSPLLSAKHHKLFTKELQKMVYKHLFACYNIENKNTAAYGGGNPHTPAQVISPPTQRNSPHRGISIPFFARFGKRDTVFPGRVSRLFFDPLRTV